MADPTRDELEHYRKLKRYRDLEERSGVTPTGQQALPPKEPGVMDTVKSALEYPAAMGIGAGDRLRSLIGAAPATDTPDSAKVKADHPQMYSIGERLPEEAATTLALGGLGKGLAAGAKYLPSIAHKVMGTDKIGMLAKLIGRGEGAAAPAADAAEGIAASPVARTSGARNYFGPSAREAPLEVMPRQNPVAPLQSLTKPPVSEPLAEAAPSLSSSLEPASKKIPGLLSEKDLAELLSHINTPKR